jgi:hypothetical protein
MCAQPPSLLSAPPPPPFLFVGRYVGGGNSGGGVSANVIDESLLADKIKAQGGKTIEDYEREEAEKKKPQPFAGAGNSIRGGTVQAAQAPAAPPEKKFTIHLWRNGIRCSCSSLAHSHSSIASAPAASTMALSFPTPTRALNRLVNPASCSLPSRLTRGASTGYQRN